MNVCVATPHAVDTQGPHPERDYGFADCAAILDVTAAAFPTGLRQDPVIDVPAKDFKPKSDEDERLQHICTFSLMIGLMARWRAGAVGGCTDRAADCGAETRGRKGYRNVEHNP